MRQSLAMFLVLMLLHSTGLLLRAQTAPAGQVEGTALARRAAVFRKNVLEAYETVGSRNPKWDGDARKVLKLALQRAAHPDEDIDWQIAFAGERAVRAGCDDTAVLSLTLRAAMSVQQGVSRLLLSRLATNAAQSQYTPMVKILALCRLLPLAPALAVGVHRTVLLRQLIAEIYANIPAALADPDLPGADFCDVCCQITNRGVELDGDRRVMIDDIYNIMITAQPQSALPYYFKAKGYRSYQNDPPRPEEAGTDTRRARRNIAKELLAKALQIDPHLAMAAADMISAIVDEGGPSTEVEKYFQIAIAADPDCYWAYYFKLVNSNCPERHEQELAFSRVCLATKRWASGIPELVLTAHQHQVWGRYWEVVEDDRNPATRPRGWDKALSELYAARPELWPDVQTLYEGCLTYNPKSATERINYARAALRAGHPALAQQQLDQLKGNKDPALKNLIAQPELRALIKAALEKAAPVTPPAP